MFRRALIVFALVLLLFPTLTQANAGKQILEEEVGSLLVWVSYDEEKAGLGEPVPFTFNLLEKDESGSVPFESLEAQIRPKGSELSLLVANINKSLSGLASITYDFPEAGVYTFTIKYRNQENVLAEHSFDFEISKDEEVGTGFVVADQEKKEAYTFKYLWIATLILGLVSGWLLRQYKSSKSN